MVMTVSRCMYDRVFGMSIAITRRIPVSSPMMRVASASTALGIGALRNADGNHFRREHEHIPALDGKRVAPLMENLRFLIDGMFRKEILSKQRFTRAHGVCHAREAHTAVECKKRVPREIEVRHRVDEEWIRIVDIIHKVPPLPLAQIALAHTAHHRIEHLFHGQLQQVFAHRLFRAAHGVARSPR